MYVYILSKKAAASLSPVKYLMMASELGHPLATWFVAKHYEEHGLPKEALGLYRSLAANGDVCTQIHLSVLLQLGSLGGVVDVEEAEQWLRQAAKKGSEEAAWRLGK